jgi:hypothetical protein
LLGQLFGSTRNRVIAGVIAVAILGGGIALAMAGGGAEQAAPTTTTEATTTTTEATTTTTAPPVAPLTGLPVADQAQINRPALVVKIDNSEPKARPQIGLNQADVVYEERVEGSVTRLLAIFHSGDSDPVGPVRSARTSDIAVFTPLNRPFFAWSGANPTFAGRIRESNIADVGYDAASDFYYRAGDRSAPHNLMLRSSGELRTLPNDGSGPPPALFAFRAPGVAPANLQPAAGVHIVYGTTAGSAPVDYTWNGTGWARDQKGTPHVDANGVQVAPENVIVQFTPYAPSDTADQFGVPIPEAQLVGQGEAWIFTAGGVVFGTWTKPSMEAVTTYTGPDGAPIGLTPGRTWVALPAPGGATIF